MYSFSRFIKRYIITYDLTFFSLWRSKVRPFRLLLLSHVDTFLWWFLHIFLFSICMYLCLFLKFVLPLFHHYLPYITVFPVFLFFVIPLIHFGGIVTYVLLHCLHKYLWLPASLFLCLSCLVFSALGTSYFFHFSIVSLTHLVCNS